MCGPALAAVPVLGSVAGAAVQSYGAMRQGQAQEAAHYTKAAEASTQANLQRRQADIELTAGQGQERRRHEQITQLMAKQRNQFATTGLTSEGSPADVAVDTIQESTLDLAAVQYGTELRAGNLRMGAMVSDANAREAVQAARVQRGTTRLNMIAPFLSLGNSTSTTQLGKLF